MDDINITHEILRELLIQASVLFAGTLGLVVAIRFWRKAPSASLWCAAAFVLALSGSALTIYAWLAGNNFLNTVVVLVLRAATYILFLIGVYAGRTTPSTRPTDSPESIWQPIIIMVRARPWLKSLFRTAFVSTFLLVFVGSVIFSSLKAESFVGIARVRLRMGAVNTTGTNSDIGLFGISASRQIQTECEVIQSEVILGRVVETLRLNERLGTKFHAGESLTTPESIAFLKACIDVHPLPDSNIIRIKCCSDRPDEAAELANTVAESYYNYLLVLRNDSSLGAARPQTPIAEIVDRARPNSMPARPNRTMDMLLGFWGSLWLAIVVGALVVWISIKFDNKQIALAGPKAGEKFGQEWVTAQNSLGAALRDQARRTDGVEALRLLDEAATTYRAVLDAGTRDRFPQGWAMAQNNLGVLLRDRAEWSQPNVAVGTLKEAVTAHRAALEVYTRERSPHYWATTQNNLGVALRDQAKRSQGTEATRLLNEAVAACRAAVEN